NPPGCTIFSEIFSNEGIEEVAELTPGTRDDNVSLATARRASRKASNPPGCTNSYLIWIYYLYQYQK
ncbi:hypothetical protein ACVGXE_01055, partial [Escherichia coli]